ncbi:hypothetical protein C8C99_3690 [Acidovorax sp. 107]|uniref:hypothetical protein n=1 Tax=Acidovorax sp. 107 TaxID=2135638 RepID=UPI000D4F10E4|nr:hypothetical protein [Acidovorax sp. 107]PUA98814.1 hypothetical protein C8C99_3690 [Acidovorax sp. 107]
MIPKVWRRMRVEARDALELVLLPGLAAVLPWPVAFRLFKALALCGWLYREPCLRALTLARGMGMVRDEKVWLQERRLITLIDHADHYLFRCRTNRWMHRFVEVSGQWQPAGKPGLLVTFHWGLGLWSLRHAATEGLHPHMLVAATEGPPFQGRWFLHRYIKARMDTVQRASGRPVIYAQGGLPKVLDTLAAQEQVLVVLDVPPDQVAKTRRVSLLGRSVNVPRVLPSLAVQQKVPVTVVLMNVDMQTGLRLLDLEILEPGNNEDELTKALFERLERVMLLRPASWHLWGEAQRFFAD